MIKTPKVRVAFVLLVAIGIAVVVQAWHGEATYRLTPVSRWMARYCLVAPPEPPAFDFCGTSATRPVLDDREKWVESIAAFRAMDEGAVYYLLGLTVTLDGAPEISRINEQVTAELAPGILEQVKDGVSRTMTGVASAAGLTVAFEGGDIRAAARRVLREMKPRGETLVPAIRHRLTAASPAVRHEALELLGSIGEGRDLAEPALIRGLLDDDAGNRAAAALAVHRLRLDSRAVIAALTLAGNRANSFDRLEIIEALGNIGPGAREALPMLTEALASEPAYSLRFLISTAICHIDPTNADGLRGLNSLLADDSYRDLAQESLRLLAVRGGK